MTKLITIVIFSMIFFSCAQVKPDADKERIDKICDKFMQDFSDKKLPAAMQLLKQNSVMDQSTVDTLLVRITSQVNNIFPNYGKMLSYEFAGEHMIKNFMAKRFYILKFDKYYLKFDFTLYNNGKGWTITSFYYNDDLTDLLQLH